MVPLFLNYMQEDSLFPLTPFPRPRVQGPHPSPHDPTFLFFQPPPGPAVLGCPKTPTGVDNQRFLFPPACCSGPSCCCCCRRCHQTNPKLRSGCNLEVLRRGPNIHRAVSWCYEALNKEQGAGLVVGPVGQRYNCPHPTPTLCVWGFLWVFFPEGGYFSILYF